MAPLILVVDDQPGVRRLVQEIFQQAGYRVLAAANGEEALALAAAQRPDLAILDVRMPVMDGVETLRQLKGLAPDLPVLMMTAVGDGDKLAEALALGARTAFTKPFDIFRLRDLARSVLEG